MSKAEIIDSWKSAGLEARKAPVIEKILRVVHVGAMLTGLLAHDGQKIFWMTNNDTISEGKKRAAETLKVFAQVLEIYRRNGVTFDLVGGCTPFAEMHTDTLDLLSAADIISGVMADYLTKCQDTATKGIKLKKGGNDVLQWLPLDGVGLSKAVIVMRLHDDEIRLGRLQIPSKFQGKIVGIPIHKGPMTS